MEIDILYNYIVQSDDLYEFLYNRILKLTFNRKFTDIAANKIANELYYILEQIKRNKHHANGLRFFLINNFIGLNDCKIIVDRLNVFFFK